MAHRGGRSIPFGPRSAAQEATPRRAATTAVRRTRIASARWQRRVACVGFLRHDDRAAAARIVG
jgi:hypothetical protein